MQAAYASPRRPRWLGGTLATWLGLGDAGAAHRHGLGCDFGYDFSQMTKMCIVTPMRFSLHGADSAEPIDRSIYSDLWAAIVHVLVGIPS